MVIIMKLRKWSFWLLVFAVPTVFAVAQDSAAPPNNNSGQTATPAANSAAGAAQGQTSDDNSTDPLKRPLTEKQKKANSKALKQELSSTYKKWLNEDVVYIITPEEKSAFKQLQRRGTRPIY